VLVVIFIRAIVFFLNDVDEVIAIENAGDRDKGMGTSMIRNEAKGGVLELGDCSIEFSEVVRTGGSPSNYDHRAKVAWLDLAA
jgi:hypothetical protein